MDIAIPGTGLDGQRAVYPIYGCGLSVPMVSWQIGPHTFPAGVLTLAGNKPRTGDIGRLCGFV